MIELDGATGEGGGQILRSALTLSMITCQPFRIARIRADRGKPGLMRQHLVAVQATARICGALVSGAALGRQYPVSPASCAAASSASPSAAPAVARWYCRPCWRRC